MSSARARDGQRVVVVTGGGGGIGAAVAEELGRRGDFVVTLDPLVTSDGSTPLPPAEETTAGRIVAAGGAARSSNASVTDADAVRDLFEGLVAERGRLDAVVNVAGITRPTSFATGREEDWRSVLAVHLDGYRNVLAAALPLMAAAGHGRILGVTSGSGWRPANTGAYGCAKRAVASLTWQLGAAPPPGVVINAMSPIAATRMVTEALERAARANVSGSGTGASGGLSLGSMPTADEIGPIGAHLVGEETGWCGGQVIFAGGSEITLVDPPRLLEAVRSDGVASLAAVLEEVLTGGWGPAEAAQLSTGGSNPRFAHVFGDGAGEGRGLAAPVVRSCVLVSDRPELAAAVASALDARGVASTVAGVDGDAGFDAAAAALASVVDRIGSVDGVVLARAARPTVVASSEPWARVLAEHDGIVGDIHADAGWARAVAEHGARVDAPVRLVTLTDATTAGGASRGQASAQLARAASGATGGRVTAYSVSIETSAASDERAVGELAAHLLCGSDAPALSGAELVAGRGWLGLRSHPRPAGSIAYGGPAIPEWLDDALRSIVGVDGDPTGDRARAPRHGVT